MIRLNFEAIGYLHDWHRCNPLKQFNHDSLVCRIKMLNNNKGHTGGGGDIFQKNINRFKPSS